ncbi:transposase [Bradyrhizobium sp. 157]|nr:transposase [Bradyrhizobium sp. 157]
MNGRIVAESYAPGAVAPEVARRHCLSPQLLFAWAKRRVRFAELAGGGCATLRSGSVGAALHWDGCGSGNTELDIDQHRVWQCGGSRDGRG